MLFTNDGRAQSTQWLQRYDHICNFRIARVRVSIVWHDGDRKLLKTKQLGIERAKRILVMEKISCLTSVYGIRNDYGRPPPLPPLSWDFLFHRIA